jgi:predicted permease
MRTLRMRLAGFIRKRRLDRELDDEIRIHLAMQEEEFRRAGMDARTAKLAALREFGGVAQVAEAYREQRGLPWLESAARDVRYAVRGIRRSPGFAVAAVLSLALGIGANTAVFSLFHTVMLRMLPVENPATLFTMKLTGGWGRGFVSYPLYLALGERKDLFQDVAARTGVFRARWQPGGGDRVELVSREFVSGNYFGLLGVRPALGRLFTDEDNRVPHGHPLAVLSYDLWHNRFGADPGILQRRLTVDDQTLTVIGVAAPGFRGVEVERRTELWVPLMMAPGNIMDANMNWLWIVGRRAAGVSRQRIQSATDALMQQYLSARYGSHGNAAFRRKAMGQRLEVRDGSAGLSMLREEFGRPLTVLMAAVGLVLLVACTNLANLLLARGAARRKEVALRYSLGATRGRLIRQAFAESSLLAVGGCVAGVAFAFWGPQYILHFLPAGSIDPFSEGPDTAVLAFTLGATILSAILFGLAPALRSTAVDPSAWLQARGTEGNQRPLLRRVLVVAQVAFSAVLVVLAGLFGHSLSQLRSVDPGLGNRNTIAFQMDFPKSWGLKDQEAIRDRFLAAVEGLPGVVAASYAFPGPFRSGSAFVSIRVPGSERTARDPVDVEIHQVGPRHFETIGTRPILGRDIDRNDTAGTRKVVVVNEAFVRAFLTGEGNPLARVVSFDDSKPQGGEPAYVIGVVPDITHYGLRERIKPTVYVPYSQANPVFPYPPTILVQARAPASAVVPALRRELQRLGPQVALTDPQTIREQIDDSIYQDRLLAALSGFFGSLALALAAIGLYGVVAYSTARRSGEIGIRIALGARRGMVLWMVLRDALVLVALGLGIGLPGALLAARGTASVLFEVRPADPASFAFTAGVLACVALAAAFVPARRAASIEPLDALRHD